MNKTETIGNRIKERRIALGMSQDELAKKLGYKSRASITMIEKDARNLTQANIKKIADILEVTPAYIMGWETIQIKADVDLLIDVAQNLDADKITRLLSYARFLMGENK